MSDDFSGVKLTPDKPAGYNAGDQIKLTLSGVDVETEIQTRVDTIGPFTISSSDGATGTAPAVQVTMSRPVVTQDSVKLVAGTYTSALGVVYTVISDGLTVTASAPGAS